MKNKLVLKAFALLSSAGMLLSACGGSGGVTAEPLAKGQASLEVAAQLDNGVGNMTFTPDNQIIFSNHPFFNPSIKVAKLNSDKKSSTPFPNAEWQTCQNADGTPKNPNTCLNWVLGIHVEPGNPDGVVWILDSGQNAPVITPKLVAWNTKQNRLERIIPLPAPATIAESQVQDFVIDKSRNVLVIADEAIGNNSNGNGDKAAFIVVDLATGAARRVLQGDTSVMPDHTRPIVIDQGKPTQFTIEGLFVGVDGITLDSKNDYVYFGPLCKGKVFRVHMADLVNPSLTTAQLGAKVETYADKPNNGGIAIDSNNNLYLTEVGERAIGIIVPDTKQYRRYVSDPSMIWPDGVTYSPDGFMYTGANQLPLAAQFNGGVAKNKAPYLVYRFRPEAPGNPGY